MRIYDKTIDHIDFVDEKSTNISRKDINFYHDSPSILPVNYSASQGEAIKKIEFLKRTGNTWLDEVAFDLEDKYYSINGFSQYTISSLYDLSWVREDEIIKFSEHYPDGKRKLQWVNISYENTEIKFHNPGYKFNTTKKFQQVTEVRKQKYYNNVEILIKRWQVEHWTDWNNSTNYLKWNKCSLGYRYRNNTNECHKIFDIRLVETSYIIIQIVSATISIGLIVFMLFKSVSFIHMISYFENKVIQNVALYLIIEELPIIYENYDADNKIYEIFSFGWYSIYTHLYPFSNLIMFIGDFYILDESCKLSI